MNRVSGASSLGSEWRALVQRLRGGLEDARDAFAIVLCVKNYALPGVARAVASAVASAPGGGPMK